MVGQIIEELSYNEIVLFSPILATIMQKFRIATNILSFLMCVMRILKRRISLVRNSQVTAVDRTSAGRNLCRQIDHINNCKVRRL